MPSQTSHRPLQNRVTPENRIIATPARGTCMGNRGILHNDHQKLGAARWRHRAWIICRLAFRNRHRAVMTPHRYTELFFLDEAVALAAGHRPCAECRRAAFNTFRDAFPGGPMAAPDMDRILHAHRVVPGTRRQNQHSADIADLPDGAFIHHGGDACLIRGAELYPYHPGGYGPALARPARGAVRVLTPRSTVEALKSGYRPDLHHSAQTGR